jgi:UDP-N-acetylmuramate: L-alanyl-gamma-D-glutamyl-meso-diaminopimelate ligase
VHQHTLLASLAEADEVLLFEPENLGWSLKEQAQTAGMQCFNSTQSIINRVLENVQPNQHILIMSNGGFNGLHQQLVDGLADKYSGE